MKIQSIQALGLSKGVLKEGRGVDLILPILKRYNDFLHQPWTDECCEDESPLGKPVGYDSEGSVLKYYDPTTKTIEEVSVGGGGAFYIEKTKAEIDTLIAASGLIPGATYKITGVDPTLYNDGTTSGTTIFLKAATTTQLELAGHGLFYNPKYNQAVAGFGIWSNNMTGTFSTIVGNFDYENKETVTADNAATGIVLAEGFIQWVSGDWSAATSITGDNSGATADVSGFTSPTYSIGDKVIRGGYSWSNVAGNVGSSTDALTLDAEWTKDVYDTTNYNIAINEIHYDYENDLIVYRADKSGNVVDGSKGSFDDWGPLAYGFVGNPISVFQWGNPFDANNYLGVSGNKVKDSYCENVNFAGTYFWYNSLSEGSYIYSNTLSNNSYIYFNTLSNNSSINSNTLSNNSGIQSNTLGSSNIQSNTLNNGRINSNTLSNSSYIQFNTLLNQSQIAVGLPYDLSGKTISNVTLSTAVINVDITAATYIFATYPREIYTRPDGTVKLKFMNNSDILEVHDITD